MICVKLLGNDGYAGMRITCRGMRDMWWRDGDMLECALHVEVCGTDHLPEIGPAGLPFLDQPPPIHKGRETRTVNDLRAEKGILILCLIC